MILINLKDRDVFIPIEYECSKKGYLIDSSHILNNTTDCTITFLIPDSTIIYLRDYFKLQDNNEKSYI